MGANSSTTLSDGDGDGDCVGVDDTTDGEVLGDGTTLLGPGVGVHAANSTTTTAPQQTLSLTLPLPTPDAHVQATTGHSRYPHPTLPSQESSLRLAPD